MFVLYISRADFADNVVVLLFLTIVDFIDGSQGRFLWIFVWKLYIVRNHYASNKNVRNHKRDSDDGIVTPARRSVGRSVGRPAERHVRDPGHSKIGIVRKMSRTQMFGVGPFWSIRCPSIITQCAFVTLPYNIITIFLLSIHVRGRKEKNIRRYLHTMHIFRLYWIRRDVFRIILCFVYIVVYIRQNTDHLPVFVGPVFGSPGKRRTRHVRHNR